MEGNTQIEENREALKHILASLVAMAGLGAGGQFTFFRQEDAAASRLARAEKSKLSPALTLPRHLYRAILRLLRPAESAVRRLIIAASRGIVVKLPPPRKPKPKPEMRRGPRAFMPVMPKKRPKPAPRAANLPLLDPLKNPFRIRRRRLYQPKTAIADLMTIPPSGLRRIWRPTAARKTCSSCTAGGTRDQSVRMISRPRRVLRTALPVTTRCDHRKPISWKYRSACCGLM